MFVFFHSRGSNVCVVMAEAGQKQDLFAPYRIRGAEKFVGYKKDFAKLWERQNRMGHTDSSSDGYHHSKSFPFIR
jgi:hypothetical protein